MDHDQQMAHEHINRLAALEREQAVLEQQVERADETAREAVTVGRQFVELVRALDKKVEVLSTQHTALHDDFRTLRNQLYALVSVFVLGFVGAAVNWILRGGLAK